MGSCHRRIHVPVTQPVDNGNIVPLYPLDNASWVWHPDCTAIDHAALRFTNDFTVDAPTACELHVSGDQRFELYLDGELLGRGPDRGDLMHWAFAAWELELTPGQHRLEALVWWMGDHAPVAQVSLRGGFVCTATGPLRDQLTTGGDAWRVSLLRGWSMHKDLGPQFVGSGQRWMTTGAARTPP